MRGVILAGGMGTRLRSETEFRPKPMIEIGDQPILWHIMKNLSCHIAYLVKWFIPPEVNIVISLPTQSSKDITKLGRISRTAKAGLLITSDPGRKARKRLRRLGKIDM